MKNGKSPFRKLALNEIKRIYHDIIYSSAYFGGLEREIIEATFEIQWMGDFITIDEEWNSERATRAAYNYIEKGFQNNPPEVSRVYIYCIENISRAFNNGWSYRFKTKSEDIDFDEKIERLLSCYKKIYEGMASVVLSLIATSFKYRKKLSDKKFNFNVGKDGRINLASVKVMEKLNVYPINLLNRGLNGHIRNAFSHEHYHLHDEGLVELWDVHPRKRKYSWGPVKWTALNLQILIDELFETSLSIITAICIFSANYKRTIINRGWANLQLERTPLRAEELENYLRKKAYSLSFELVECVKNTYNISVKLKTKRKGVDQDSEMFAAGGDSIPRKWIIKIKYIEQLIIQQVLGFFQLSYSVDSSLKKIMVEVYNYDSEYVGSASVLAEKIYSFGGPTANKLEKDRALLEIDTLKNEKMFVKIESDPIEA
jgi:hypothetical protein